MDIKFLSYNQVTTLFKIGFENPEKGNFQTEAFTVDTIETLLKAQSQQLNPTMNEVKKAIIEKGGKLWVETEVKKYQQKQMSGNIS